jgi:hypothetical protein
LPGIGSNSPLNSLNQARKAATEPELQTFAGNILKRPKATRNV